ncbi:HlyD family secretion protein [Geotalea sp. SG265]|uniref:HlyD family secretion protein n=1 Tax=Geotalea sp. SG265 TaxID=2922867 RepID=UPI001FAFCB1B|nr:HlyD family secretion protein [Geotalea sp. SG265]
MAAEVIENTSEESGKGPGKRRRAGIILLVMVVLMLFFGGRWWITSRTHITTDNAFVEAHVHSISPRIPATVKSVLVVDNQFVRKGDLLVELDPRDYEMKVATANASMDMARNETSGEHAKVATAKTAVNLARVRLDQAQIDLDRGKALFNREVVPKDQLDKLQTAYRVAVMDKRQAEEALRQAEAEVGLGTGGRDAKVAQKKAQLDEARLNLSYTRIAAPADGYVTRKSVEPGNYVQTGQPLMALVALQDGWVTANYKESQLTNVRPGQKVTFTVDAYPGQAFRGAVESIMAGTGAAFSLLPPENATGNYVKVVQRIPVRIDIDRKSDPQHVLRVGMSVVPTIIIDKPLGEILREIF